MNVDLGAWDAGPLLRRFIHPFVGVASLAGLFISCTWIQSGPGLGPTPWLLPERFKEVKDDPAKQQYEYYDFMWRSFVALNWPNVPVTIESKGGERVISKGFRGQPDPSNSILDQTGSGDLSVTVWERYREPSEVFLEPARWKNYPLWNTPRPLPEGSETAPDARGLLRYSEGFVEYAADVKQPYFFPDTTGPLRDRHGKLVRYEVAINQAFFTYIRHFRYFDGSRQVADVAAAIEDPENRKQGFQRPPFGDEAYLSELPVFAKQGLVDVKAAWRVLDPEKDHLERYLHRKIIIDDRGTSRLLGLVALHILRFTPNGPNGSFVAATFEQVDNVSVKYDPIAGLKPSFNTGAQPSQTQAYLGFEGAIPDKESPPVSIYRVTHIPGQGKEPTPPWSVQAANQAFQAGLKPSVFQYYELVGTQNKHPGRVLDFKTADGRALNGHEGPVTGVYTNTNNLINSALESYTQRDFSCILCHARARPLGVPNPTNSPLVAARFPEKALQLDRFKTLTFLLKGAKWPKTAKSHD